MIPYSMDLVVIYPVTFRNEETKRQKRRKLNIVQQENTDERGEKEKLKGGNRKGKEKNKK